MSIYPGNNVTSNIERQLDFFIYNGIKEKTSSHILRGHALRSAGSAQIHAMRGLVSENRRSNSENNKPVFKENYANLGQIYLAV